MKIVCVVARDIRFPTSEVLSGSDDMDEAPDYSAAEMVHVTHNRLYVRLLS